VASIRFPFHRFDSAGFEAKQGAVRGLSIDIHLYFVCANVLVRFDEFCSVLF